MRQDSRNLRGFRRETGTQILSKIPSKFEYWYTKYFSELLNAIFKL